MHKVIYYLNEKGRVDWPSQQLVTRCFFQKVQDGIDSSGYVRFSRNRVQFRGTNLTESNWEGSSGAHLGGKVADEILALANEQAGLCLEPLPYMVSVIVPSLNEERTISQTLSALRLLNFAPLGVTKEIIVADGGSTDRTLALAQEEPSVRVLSVPQCRGRGHALRFGAEQALGNIIVFFPSDGEYEPRDLLPAVKVLIHNEFQVVFGSRAIKCVNVADRIRTIYQRNYLGYFIGHYGGMALSFISLLLHKRYVSDPLTGVKGFRRSAFRSLSLESNGLDLETEIIAKISHQGIFLLELPIEYFPRTKSQGKKTTVWDGLKALWALFRYRSRTYAKTVHRDTGLQRGGVHWNAPSIGQSS
ncbi:MAG: glycosyltransferase family 2 protein [Deltaproteobacteria bacterium]|nr:glycosyltransferase family 2 protein [Deltaproteobacteria bacterium]